MLRRAMMAGGSTVWSPMAMSPQTWLDDASSLTDNSGCEQWNDRTPNGYHFGQSSAVFRPAVNASGLNGLRTITGDGINDDLLGLSAGIRDIYRSVSHGWAGFVWNRVVSTGGGANRLLWQYFGTSATTRFRVFCDSTGGANKARLEVRRQDADSPTSLYSAASVNSGPHMMLCWMNWGTGEGRIYIDGELDASNASLTSAGSTPNNSGNAPVLLSSGSSAWADAKLAEFIAGNSALSDDLIDRWFGYVAHHWGLASLLDVSHPYKGAPP